MATKYNAVEDFDWTEEKCLHMIKEYRARPILWDRNHPFYYKSPMKPDAWEEIGKILNTTAATCKHKMGVLMSSFRREKAKIAANIKKKGKSRNYRSNWFAFKEMIFLMENKAEIAAGSPTVYTNDNDMFSKRQKTSTNKRNETPHLTPVISINQVQTFKQMPTEPQPPLRQYTRQKSNSDEEIKFFATFIATKMKKFSERTKNAVQKEICEIVFRADQGFYENTNAVRPNSSYINVTRFNFEDSNVGASNETVIKNYYSDGE